MQKLNDLLKLTGRDLKCAKLAANIHDKRGHTCFDRWKNSSTDNRDISYLFWSHYTENGVSRASRNFSDVGQIVVGLVRIPNKQDQWLLVAVGKITTLPGTHDTPNTCGYTLLNKYSHLFGKVVVTWHKGNKNSRYVFWYENYMDELVVSSILAKPYC